MTQAIPPVEAEVLERFHDAVLVRDMTGRIVFWNAASEALYGWTSDYVMGLSAIELLKCEHADPPSVANAIVLDKGEWQGELTRTMASGKRRLVRVHWSVRRDAEGNPMGVMETAQDISTVRETEVRLRESEYRYRNLFQAMAASFWELDFTLVGARLRGLLKSGVSDLNAYFMAHPEVVWQCLHETKVIDVNDHTVRLFGRGNRQEMLGPSDRYWPQASIQTYARCVAAAVARKPNNTEVTRLKTLDGREVECLFTACFSEENVARGIILVGVIDLSEQVAARNAVEAMRAELAHAARISILGELTASIAHEINQPMSSISTYADAGLRWLSRPVPDLQEVENALTSISRDTRRAHDVIDRIRSMAIRATPENCVLSINDVIRESLLFMQFEVNRHGIHVQLDLDPSLPGFHGDRVLMQQVIVNLLMNAIQAMAHGGTRQRALTVTSASLDDTAIRIEITDSGPGIDQEHSDKLFESFFTTKRAGMGMGLPICKSIVVGAGGSITLSNRHDGQSGAQLVILLPTARLIPA
jgi:PAS domain S-box-containing protein